MESIKFNINSKWPLNLGYLGEHNVKQIEFEGYVPKFSDSIIAVEFQAPIEKIVPLNDNKMVVKHYLTRFTSEQIITRLVEIKSEDYPAKVIGLASSKEFYSIVHGKNNNGWMPEVEDPEIDLYFVKYKNLYDSAMAAVEDAEESAESAEEASETATTAKNDAVTAKNDAVTAKNDAVTAKNAAVAAKDALMIDLDALKARVKALEDALADKNILVDGEVN